MKVLSDTISISTLTGVGITVLVDAICGVIDGAGLKGDIGIITILTGNKS